MNCYIQQRVGVKNALLRESSQTQEYYYTTPSVRTSTVSVKFFQILSSDPGSSSPSRGYHVKRSGPAPNPTQNPAAYKAPDPKAAGGNVSASANQSSVGSSLNLSYPPCPHSWGSKDGAPSGTQEGSWELSTKRRMEGWDVPQDGPFELFSSRPRKKEEIEEQRQDGACPRSCNPVSQLIKT